MAEVIVLRPGYATWEPFAKQRACGTISLVISSVKMIVDTDTAVDREFIIDKLGQHELKPEDIDYVVCTHGHSDHIGNNNLFPQATFIVGYDLSRGDEYTFIDYTQGPHMINEEIQILYTPGHTSEDISVIVKTAQGLVAIVGDLFENSHDIDDASLWIAFSRDQEAQSQSRTQILEIADFIVPGHGDMFIARGKSAGRDQAIIAGSTTSTKNNSHTQGYTIDKELSRLPIGDLAQVVASALKNIYAVPRLEAHPIRDLSKTIFSRHRSETITDYSALHAMLIKEIEEFGKDVARQDEANILHVHHIDKVSGNKPWEALHLTRATYYRRLRDAYPAFAQHLRQKELTLRSNP